LGLAAVIVSIATKWHFADLALRNGIAGLQQKEEYN
jgi:hypothetical protein